ncbi:MAG: endonuclease III domain-containing protein [Deltaproteobacteria bacterium]|nr:endonuclease III domain-containing protein [Deltaproteobacteria bacterium]
MPNLLMDIYRKLYKAYGPRHWWPGETPFEVMVGAILTQNTSWKNVEMAIRKLKANGVLNPDGIYRLKEEPLGSLIRSSGFYRIKAKRLKTFVSFLFNEYDGDIHKMKRGRVKNLREKLLGINGIGPETADSILLYGLQKPIFVVDAYTKKVLSRHGIVSEKASYEAIQNLFMEHLPHEERLFNEYHALIVHVGKNVCKKKPECERCPLRGIGHNVVAPSFTEGANG